MQSVVEVLKKAEGFLQRAGLETPKIDAEWLLAEILGCRRLDLFLQFDRPLEEEALVAMRESVKRRAKGEPLQFIFGYSEFHDIRLDLKPGVLIPRPETELLVGHVISRLEGVASPRIVDLGTGSGAIALALAKALPESRVLAVERSQEALAQARDNAEALDLRERVAFRSGSWLEGLDFQADCIVSNPPYLTMEEWQSARPEVREHEPMEALVADEDGLADLRQIVEAAPERLVEGGLLALEMGVGHGKPLSAIAKAAGFVDVVIETDDSDRDRFLFARK